MTDITMYSDDELSLLVNNIEYLYSIKCYSFEELLGVLKDIYIYTDTQLQVLINDYNNED